LYKQLLQNPKTEACFYKQEGMIGTMLRVAGAVEFINDKALKQKVLEERPFLKEYGLTIDSPGLVVFKIGHGQAHFWTMENNLKPKEIVSF
jgi:pyridoxamine 5'-phosphate oxidase